ncbi:MAG: homoserine O-acetyltransferase [Acidobacteriota bacterium]
MARPYESGPEPQYDKVVSGYLTFHHSDEYPFELGGSLPEITLAYETWGELSRQRDNAVLLHTGLSASSHAKSHPENPRPGWWEAFIGPGLAIDTDRWFVICTNLLGGCYGSTGPSSEDARTGEPYATGFPILTVTDMVRAQMLLLDHLGIGRLHASIGSSLGGMQSLAVAASFASRVDRIVSISAAGRSYPMSIAMRFVQRSALMADPDWRGGHYYGRTFPHRGMKVAREIGTITSRSGPEWQERFGRQRTTEGTPRLEADFEVESYLAHQGEKFCLQYDPNSYLYVSKAMDLFDLGDGQPSYEEGVARVQCPALVIGVKSDILFPSWQQRELADLIARGGAPVTFLELDAPFGHDTFLIAVDEVGGAIRSHLEASEAKMTAPRAAQATTP